MICPTACRASSMIIPSTAASAFASQPPSSSSRRGSGETSFKGLRIIVMVQLIAFGCSGYWERQARRPSLGFGRRRHGT